MLYFYMLVDIPNCLYCQGGGKKKKRQKQICSKKHQPPKFFDNIKNEVISKLHDHMISMVKQTLWSLIPFTLLAILLFCMDYQFEYQNKI